MGPGAVIEPASDLGRSGGENRHVFEKKTRNPFQELHSGKVFLQIEKGVGETLTWHAPCWAFSLQKRQPAEARSLPKDHMKQLGWAQVPQALDLMEPYRTLGDWLQLRDFNPFEVAQDRSLVQGLTDWGE